MNYLHSTSGFRLVICHTFNPQEQGPSNLMLLAQRGLLLPKGTKDMLPSSNPRYSGFSFSATVASPRGSVPLTRKLLPVDRPVQPNLWHSFIDGLTG